MTPGLGAWAYSRIAETFRIVKYTLEGILIP